MVVSKLDAARAARLAGDIPQNVNFAMEGALVPGFLESQGKITKNISISVS